MKKDNLAPFKIAMIYAAFSALWILLSDQLLFLLIKDPEILTRAQMIKGWLFIIISGLIIFSLLKGELKKHLESENALRESEKRYRNIIERTPDIRYSLDMDGTVLFISPAIYSLSGYTAQELTDTKIGDDIYTETEDGSNFFELLEQRGEVNNFETELIRKDGSIRWASTNARYFTDHNGNRLGIEGVIRDVTERKVAEKALRESERKYRLLADNAHDVIFVLNMDLEYIYISPSVKMLRGYEPEEIIGSSPSETLTPESWEHAMKTMTEIMELVKSGDFTPPLLRTMEFEIKKKDGTTVWTEITLSLVMDEKKDPIGILGVTRDIDKRKHAEKMLKESEARFKALHNASFGGIAIHDMGVILDCNRGLSDMTGYSVSELTGMDGLLLIAKAYVDTVKGNIRRGYEKPYEVMGVRKNGEEYPLRLEARNIPYQGKNVRVVEFRDITENKRTETEKEHLQAQLTQAQKMESVGRLAGGVAHDFNNMLSIIQGNTEIILDDIDPSDPAVPGLHEIQKAAGRSTELTRQLLAFARKQTISPVTLNLNETIEGMLKMLERLIGENVEISWRPHEDLWPVRIDPSQVDQILANLCVNARDAIENVGRVTIETDNIEFDEDYCRTHSGYRPGNYVMISVSDSGCGMDKETLGNLFEPFFTTKRTGEGTGLGLSTVYGIIKQNSGFINVYSEPEEGSVFKIYLPAKGGKVRPEQKTGSQKILSGNETILLVEDEEAILKMTRIMLERLGYSVRAVSSPLEAVRIGEESDPGIFHLLITDVVMPEMNGRDLYLNMRKKHRDLKCLFMSGYTADVIANHGILDKGLKFINKPFSIQALSRKLRKILEHG